MEQNGPLYASTVVVRWPKMWAGFLELRNRLPQSRNAELYQPCVGKRECPPSRAVTAVTEQIRRGAAASSPRWSGATSGATLPRFSLLAATSVLPGNAQRRGNPITTGVSVLITGLSRKPASSGRAVLAAERGGNCAINCVARCVVRCVLHAGHCLPRRRYSSQEDCDMGDLVDALPQLDGFRKRTRGSSKAAFGEDNDQAASTQGV